MGEMAGSFRIGLFFTLSAGEKPRAEDGEREGAERDDGTIVRAVVDDKEVMQLAVVVS